MNERRDALVGLTIVTSILVIVFGTLWLEGSGFGGEDRVVEAVFAEVGQIKPGNPVKLRGVRIGRVRSMRVSADGEGVILTLRVQDGVQFPPDAVVILSPESLFGDWQAEIHSRDRFPHAAYAIPRSPEMLPGYALPDVSQLTAAADRISENVAVLTDRVGIAFSEETARNVASLIENVEAVTERLSDLVNQQAQSFQNVTDEVQRSTAQIGGAAAEARGTFERFNRLLGQDDVGDAVADLAVVMANLRDLTADLRATNVNVREMAARADSAFVALERVAVQAGSGDGSVARLLQDPTVASGVEVTLTELQDLLRDIRENPRRYLRLSIF
jgi:phospholipid/cholesterol/gamma-HCH transport system substrate-binding protein